MHRSPLPRQVTTAMCCWHRPVSLAAHPVAVPVLSCRLRAQLGRLSVQHDCSSPATPKSLAAERRSTFLHAIQRLEVSLRGPCQTRASQVLASTASAMIIPGILSAAHLDVCSCLVSARVPGSCSPCWIGLSHTAAALQTLKTENGHLWSLIEGHASAEGQWAARLQQDGSSLQALEAERRALRQQVRGCPDSHSHLQAACSPRQTFRQQVTVCPQRHLRLQAACTSCRAAAGMAVGHTVQFNTCALC